MTDELCAREGCGESKILHSSNFTLAKMARAGYSDTRVVVGRPEGTCVANGCDCPAYLAPTPPEPELKLKAYVFESSVATRMPSGEWALPSGHVVIPLDDYLAAHPQPSPALCICGGREDEHHGKCTHVARFLTQDRTIVQMRCQCQTFRVQP